MLFFSLCETIMSGRIYIARDRPGYESRQSRQRMRDKQAPLVVVSKLPFALFDSWNVMSLLLPHAYSMVAPLV